MTDIHNVQAFALYMEKTDVKFDLYSVTKEMEKQVDIITLLYFLFNSLILHVMDHNYLIGGILFKGRRNTLVELFLFLSYKLI